MKAKAFKIINLILAVLVFVFALSQAFAWFAEDMRKSDDKFDGSSSSPYFNSGTGTSGDPFTLTKPNHLYNLAWLQNTGNLNDNYYYFRLDDDIDMSGYWLPPIGTDDYPFQGYFNGNGKKISNLKITTDSTKLTGAVSGSSVKYSYAVGMFGMTAAHVGVTDPKIYNFNLIDPIVEVATQNASYNSASEEKKNVGIAIGYANCGAENIGVLNGKLSIQNTGYTSKNSIVGDYDGTKVNGDEIDSDIGSGGDTGQFIPDVFAGKYSNLTNIMSNATDFKINTWVLPKNDSAGVGLGAFSFITGDEETKVEAKTVTSFTYYTASTSVGNITTYNSTGGTLTIDLSTESTYSNVEEVRNKVLNGTTQLTQLDYLFYFKESPATIKPDDTSHTLNAVYETNTVYSNAQTSTVLNNSIKVRVKKNSTKIFVIASSRATSGASRYLGVYKVSDRVTDFNTRVNDSTYKEENFDKAKPLMQLELPANPKDSPVIVACEFDLSGSEAGAGTYQLNSTGSGINFHYISVTGTTDGDSGSTVTDPKLKNVDFIYEDSSSNVVLIDNASFIATNVIVKFEIKQITYLYFYRPEGGKDINGYTLDVKYNGTAPEAKISSGGGCSPVSDSYLNGETLLTYPSAT
ncbi:MAG: hypothetical protein ACI4MQ_05275 [Candidatus Coproplasma sp.]